MTTRLDDLTHDRRDPLLRARISEGHPAPVLGELSGQPRQHVPQDPANQLTQLREWCASTGHTIDNEYTDFETGRKAERKRLTLVFPLGHTPGRVGIKRKFQFADIANEIVRKISDLLVLSCELQHFLARFVM